MCKTMERLKDPFPEEDIEWRVQQCGKKNEKMWAQVLAYVTNRAIQERLDEVFGLGGWQNEYSQAPEGGILCGIKCKIENEWITKYDGAENTNIEPIKGGLSSAMKRAAVQWGIGRYLYKLEANFVDVQSKKSELCRHYINDSKKGVKGFWAAPKLPTWALPTMEIKSKIFGCVSEADLTTLWDSLNAEERKQYKPDFTEKRKQLKEVK